MLAESFSFAGIPQLDCCPLSRLVVPVSAPLVTLALSNHLLAALWSSYGRQVV